MAALTYKGSVVGASSTTGDSVGYNNADSGLQATNVQDAIDELEEAIGALPTSDTTYTLEAGTGDDANKIVLTPSEGTAQKVTVPYANNAGTVNGKTVESNVPANAVFTDNDTTYTLSAGTGDDSNKVVLTPSSGSAQKLTVPYASSAGDAATVNGKTVAVSVPADAKFTDTTYDNATTTTAGLMSATDKGKVDALGTAASKDVPATGNASSTQVVMGNDTRLSDARPASNTTDTYSSTGTAPVSGKAVNAALGTLDVTGDSNISAGKTIKSWSETDGKVSVTTQNISITKSQVSDFPALGTASAKDVPATGNASSTQVVMGNDTRLTDARTPVSHTHTKSEITDFPTSLPASNTTDTYSSTGTAPVSGKAVAAALGTLDVTGATGIGAGKTISAWSETDGKVSISTQDISITKSQVSDFPASLPASNTTNTYSASGTAPVSGKAVAAALGTLDVSAVGGSGKYLTTISETDGKISATAATADTTVTNGSSNLVTSGAVFTAIENLPEPMVFKGSLGTGGTITALPVDGSASIGDTYKVITAGTYASQAAKVGDTFICLTKTSSANTWELIPSGDEPSGTVTSVKITANSPITVSSASAITTSGTRTIGHATSGATAGSYGDSTAQEPGYGSTFKVPYVTVNDTGHVTAISEHTVKIPASDNTNTTYTFANGTNGFTVTPSGGSAQTVTVTPNDSTKLPLAGGTLTGAVEFKNGKMPLSAGKITGLSSGASRVYGDGIAISNPTTANDVGFIRVTGTGESDTVLEICTGDDGGGSTAETIAVRQYNTSNAIAKEAKLLDPSGNTTFPGKVTASSFVGSIANATGLTKSQVTTALGYTPPTSDTNTTYSAGTGTTITGTNNAINVTYGSAANTACQGNDSRLSNARQVVDNVLTNQDLNNVTTPGFYSAGGGNSVTNKPSGVSHFGLLVIHGAGGSHYIQKLSAPNLAKSYTRFCTGDTTSWSAWVQDATATDISTLQLNFQAGVDSVYNAIVAQGTTPASKSLSDVVAGVGSMSTNRYNAGTTAGYNTKKNSLTGTYTPSANGSKLDMGADHTKRYVDTRTVYNSGTTAGYNTKKNSLTGTYAPASNGTAIDMGADHTKRYVDTSTVYNAATASGYSAGSSAGYTNGYNAGTTAGYNTKKNSLTGTYTPSANGSKLDMGADHTKRYVDTRTVYNSGTTAGYNTKKNSLTGTYTPTTSTTAADMGADHTQRYVNTTSVYNAGTAAGYSSGSSAGYTNGYNAGTTAGYNTKKNSLTGTYTPTGSGGSKLDMGADHTKRYVDTTTVYNTGTSAGYTTGYNAGTTAGYNTKKNSLTGTYTPSANGSKHDMGADHTFRYVNTNTVYNAGTQAGYNSGTAAGYTSGYNAGTTDGYNTKKNSLTGTYTPSSNASNHDMGADHTFRYVDTRTVYNSGTAAGYSSGSSAGYTNGYNAGTTAGYNTKKNSLTGTYTPIGGGGTKLDMGPDHTKRYINTDNVYNAGTSSGYNTGTTAGYNTKKNSLTGTYTPTGSGGSKLEMGADHTFRYVNTNNVYNAGTSAGWDKQNLSWIGTVRTQGTGSGSVSMSNLSAGRYLVISTSVPNIVDCGWSAGCTVTLNTGSTERVIAHENKGSSGQYYWAYWVGIVKLTNTSPTNSITVKHNYGSGVTNTRSIIVMKYQG